MRDRAGEPDQWQAETLRPAHGLWVSVLGPVQVVRDGIEMPPSPRAPRTVLGLLVLAFGAPVRQDAAIDALWGEHPPASAVGTFQTYVSRLRSMLNRGAGDKDVLVRDSSGYRLRLSAGQLDALAFRRLTAQARAARAPEEACDSYERALSLWRGEPLADVEPLHGHPAVIALADELSAVTVEYAECAAANGWHDRVLPYLKPLTARGPLDERSHAALMVALAGSGRQAAALRVYEEIRRRLAEQLGVDPGPELRAAHARVLRQQVSTGVVQVPAPRQPWRPVFQLPAAPADFTGRASEREDLLAAIAPGDDQPGVPVAAVCGQPGIGKTSLALYVAHKAGERFPDGQLWVQLAGTSARPRDPGDVLGELLRALGVPGAEIPGNDAERAVAFRSMLAGRRVLVVADDAASARQVEPLRPGTPGCALIVTSRMRLEGLSGAHLIPLDVMTAADATDLLGRLIGAGRMAAERTSAAALREACGDLPLALRIVGAKLAVRPAWPLSVMLDRLSRSRDRLGELRAGELSVRASIASSYESLPEPAARAFRLLALLGAADFAEWVIGALAGEYETSGVLDELAGRSLLTATGADAVGEPRYRLHDLIRDYAAERLAAEPRAARDAALERLLRGWLQLACGANAKLPPEPYFPPARASIPADVLPATTARRLTADPLAWFTAERTGLRAAVDQACRAGLIGLARGIASAQCAFQHLQDRHDEAETLWRLIAEHATGPRHQADAVYARLRVGASLVERGRAAQALGIFNDCVEASERAGELEVLASALYWRGVTRWDLDDFELGAADARRGREVAIGAGSRLAGMLNLRLLCLAYSRRGDHERAIAFAEQAVEAATEIGGGPYELAALHNLAYACALGGRGERAVDICLRRIELSRKLGDARGEAHCYGVLGDAYLGLGEYEKAARSLLRALPVFKDHKALRHYGVCLLKIGYAYEGMRCWPEAVDYLERARDTFRQISLPKKAEEAERAIARCETPDRNPAR